MAETVRTFLVGSALALILGAVGLWWGSAHFLVPIAVSGIAVLFLVASAFPHSTSDMSYVRIISFINFIQILLILLLSGGFVFYILSLDLYNWPPRRTADTEIKLQFVAPGKPPNLIYDR